MSSESWMDKRLTFRVHYDEFRRFLDSMPPSDAPQVDVRVEKLGRLTVNHFQELTTDVFDEITRRSTNTLENEVSSLSQNLTFHPKRNEARRKMAYFTLSLSRDMVNEVLREIEHRYPEFKGA
ncbi:component of the polarisome [Tulasnella sp. 419]|nr:component of the polarisome [Tulasnella sp. 419]